MKRGSSLKIIDLDKLPVFQKEATISEIEKNLRINSDNYETIDYIYLVEGSKLVGVVSIKEIFLFSPETIAFSISNTKPIFVNPHLRSEKVAMLAVKHRIKAMPVVGNDHTFLGIITSDQIREIIRKELSEDIFKSVGVLDSEKGVLGNGVLKNVRIRTPWLIFGLVGGLAAVQLISLFEVALEETIILAAFIPLITYMSDAVGNQSQIIFIRTLAIDEKVSKFAYLGRELSVSLLISLVLSALIFIILSLSNTSEHLAEVVSISLFLTVNIASMIGVVLPLIFTSLKLDPAIASGPFATIIRDLSSLLIYLSVASLFI